MHVEKKVRQKHKCFREVLMMSDEYNNNFEQEPAETADNTSGQAEKPETSYENTGTTYSWVNPKIAERRQAEQSNYGSPYGAYTQNTAAQSESYTQNTAAQSESYTQSSAAGSGSYTQSSAAGSGSYTQSTAPGSGSYSQNTYRAEQVRPRPAKKKKKSMGIGKKIGLAAAIAAVFGLVAGSLFFAVNFAGNTLFGGKTAQTVGSADTTAPFEVKTSPESTVNDTASEITEKQDTKVDYVTPILSNNTADGLSVAEVTEMCMPSLVTVSMVSVQEMQNIFGQKQKYEVSGAGSGVIIGENETELLIATNYHVVADATTLSVGFIDETAVEATVKGQDRSTDLAVIAVKLADIPEETLPRIRIITIGDSSQLVLGEQIVAIGNALGFGQSVTSGYVSAFDREVTGAISNGETLTSTGLIQIDAAINSGNSGGALINMKGELVGINEARTSYSSSGVTVDNMGYAIPMAKALPVLTDLMNQETREKVAEEDASYLGVSCADVSEDVSKMYGMPVGVCFTTILEGSPAEQAGLLVGDIMVAFDGQEVLTNDAFTDLLNYYPAGTHVVITIYRANNGEYIQQDVDVTLGHYSELEKYYEEMEQQAGQDNPQQVMP